MHDKLLTKKDLAERWQVSLSTIDNYVLEKIITPVKGLHLVRFNPQHIAKIEQTELDKHSPLEFRRLEHELEETQKELNYYKSIFSELGMLYTKVAYEQSRKAI